MLVRTAEINAELGLPFGMGKLSGKWVPEELEREAAWEVLVELTTRISLVPIDDEHGSLREMLSSLRDLFPLIRDILKRYGPGLAAVSVEGSLVSFAHLTVGLLNGSLRPLLAKWHVALREHEESKPCDVGPMDWESRWSRAPELRGDLAMVQASLRTYATILARVCGAESMLVASRIAPSSALGSVRG